MGKKLKDWGGILPDGQYKFRCTRDTECNVSQKGGLFISWALEVLEGPAGTIGEILQIITNLGAHKFSQKIVKAWLVAFGAEEEDDIPEEDCEAWNVYLEKRCMGNVAFGFLTKTISEKYGTQNVIAPPDGIYKQKGAAREISGGAEREEPDFQV